jgi:hypothetical protein
LAAGLIRDVRTLFQPPPGFAQSGALADGTPVCRYASGHTVTDILPQEDGCWRMHTYSAPTPLRADGSEPADSLREPYRDRTIEATSCREEHSAILPHALALTASGPTGYTLNMRMLSAEPFPGLPPCLLP